MQLLMHKTILNNMYSFTCGEFIKILVIDNSLYE